MDLKGKKALFIVASRGFRDEELIEPKSILESYGAKCIIANETGRESVGMLGKVVDASMTLDKVDVNDYFSDKCLMSEDEISDFILNNIF